MRAVVLTAAVSEDGAAHVIALTDTAILFGVCREYDEGIQASWFRLLFKNGSNRAVALSSWKAGHDDAPPAPPALNQLLTGPAPGFVVPGDYFEVDLQAVSDRRKTVRMPQDTFDALMRGLLAR